MGTFQICIDQFNSFKSSWTALFPTLPENFPHNGVIVGKVNVDQLISEIGRLLVLADRQDNPDMAMISIHYPGISSQCQQLPQFVAQLPANPIGFFPHIVNTLWGLKSSIYWVLPANIATIESWQVRMPEAEETIGAINQVFSKANSQLSEIKSTQEELSTILASLPKVKEFQSEIQKITQEVSNAKASAEGSAANAAAKQEEASMLIGALQHAVTNQNNLINYFEEKLLVVESTLAGASQIGLAKSFSDMQDTHFRSKGTWETAFYLGLIIMVLIEAVVSFLPGFPSLSNNTWLTWFISRITVISPVIWFTWFSSLQYSRAMRLEEDYAFKAAAAKSFYGYKKEMEYDSELLKMLQESSIKNFGSNPIRLLGKHDHGSPLHEAIDKLVSKGVLDKSILEKLLDALRTLTKSDGK